MEVSDDDTISLDPSEPAEPLEPIPQEDESSKVAVTRQLQDKLARMILTRQQVIERQGDTTFVDKHIKEMEAFLAESARELEAMEEDSAKRTLAEREGNSAGAPLQITNGEVNSLEEQTNAEPKFKRGRL